jgi:hypothetical protein
VIGALPPRALGGHQSRLAKQREVGGNARLREIEPSREIGYGRIALPQDDKQPQPGFVGEGLANLGNSCIRD